ncbi:MAG: NB-ARC domain-containing protein [Cyanobacteria bacterium]|nr:NB-ARC domain-containing protein [Cyanobacteriota bacterium]
MQQTSTRSRGVVLTIQGKKRLEASLTSVQKAYKGNQRFTQKQLSQRVGLSIKTIKKIRDRSAPVDEASLHRFFKAFGLTLQSSDYGLTDTPVEASPTLDSPQPSHRRDWIEAKEVSNFCGREEELTTLKQWILKDQCRLVALLGLGGIGKSVLAKVLMESIYTKFSCSIWLDLREAPPIRSILLRLITFLSDQKEGSLSETLSSSISKIVDYLKNERCLIVLDNFESLFKSGELSGDYRESYEKYGELIQRIGESKHQSCLVITSRERPQKIWHLEKSTFSAKAITVRGLPLKDAREILASVGVQGDDAYWDKAFQACGGNPLMMVWGINIIRKFKSEVHQPGSQLLPAFATIAKAGEHICPIDSGPCGLLWVS